MKDMEKDIAFVTVAFGSRYLEQVHRLIASVNQFDYKIYSWLDQFPPGSKHHDESMYGFKVHAIHHAFEQGYNNIIWCDPAMILQKPVEYYFRSPMPEVVVVKDDNLLTNHIADSILEKYNNPDISGVHLVGGSVYVFDFNKQRAHDVFRHWFDAERNGFFGSQKEAASEKINKHRNDESCMAIALLENGISPIGHDLASYCSGSDSIFIKKHFKQ